MNLSVRTATPADAVACAELDRRCFEPGVAYDLDDFKEICAQAHVVLIAEVDGEMAGFAAAELEDRSTGLIVTLDVEEAWRRRGIGSRLLADTHERLAALGATTVFLHVAVERDDAQRLYRRHGYSTIARLNDYYALGRDAFVMTRTLEVEEPPCAS
jgi:ribosomal-protein-alanine N-acetyltransferase